MLRGATPSALAIVGTAVFRIVVSSDSMKKATATSHGNNRFKDSPGVSGDTAPVLELVGLMLLAIASLVGENLPITHWHGRPKPFHSAILKPIFWLLVVIGCEAGQNHYHIGVVYRRSID